MPALEPARRLESLALAAVFLAAVGYIAIGFRDGINFYDEGVFMYGGARVLAGEVPYRDFWTLNGPGQFYALAGLYEVFGPTMMTVRVVYVVTMFALSVVVYHLALQIVAKPYAVFAVLLWVARAGAYTGFAANNVHLGLLFSLLSVLGICRYLGSSARLPLVLGGLAAGIATVFRQDFGAYTVAAEVAVTGAFLTLENPGGWRRIPRALAPYAAAVAAIVLPIGAYFVGTVGWRMADFLVLFPLTIYPKVYALPFPPLLPATAGLAFPDRVEAVLTTLPLYLPFAVYLADIGCLAVLAWQRRLCFHRPEIRSEVLVLALGIVVLNHLRRRPDGVHVFPSLVPTVLLMVALIARIPRLPRARAAAASLAAAMVVAFVVRPLIVKAETLTARPAFTFTTPRARGITWSGRGASYQAAIEFVRRVSAPGERIFVGNTRHDLIGVNDALFYFLADRPSATRYHELARGLATTREVQEEIIGEIEHHAVRWIVLRREWDYERTLREQPRGADVLDRYIRAGFTPVAEFGNYSVWRRISG